MKLKHSDGEAERFYRGLQAPALVGMESVGNSLWFEWLGHELWIGNAAQIRASYVRRQKTDRRDAGHILRLLVKHRFPRIWVPNKEQRDQRQLLVHRHRLVQMRSRNDEHFHKEYRHRCHHKPTGVAKVAAAHKLAVRLNWMLRTQTPYPQIVHNEGSPSHLVVGAS